MTNSLPETERSAPPDPDTVRDLTDLLAQGVLTPAELACVSSGELDALHELGCRRLDTDHVHEAVIVLGALVALSPFEARHWRAYGVALHRDLSVETAVLAYRAALTLEPDHGLTRTYLGEVLLYGGDLAAAADELNRVRRRGPGPGYERAGELLEILGRDDLEVSPTPYLGSSRVESETAFTLTDGTPLPLSPAEMVGEERTETEVIAQPGSGSALRSTGDETVTAVVARRVRPGSGVSAEEVERTLTAIVRRRHGLALAEDDGGPERSLSRDWPDEP